MTITLARHVSKLAALSCESPFLIVQKDKALLRPGHSFLHKIVSALHLNENIVLSSAPFSFYQNDSLFVVVDGPCKELASSSGTSSRWIPQTRNQAYAITHKVPFFFNCNCSFY